MQSSLNLEAQPDSQLRLICVVRHGKYGERNLTAEGRSQILNLARLLKPRFQGLRIIVDSSHLTRAKESAEILGDQLKVEQEIHEFLAAPGDDLEYEQVQATLKLIDEQGEKYDGIVLVTHMPFIDKFPEIWGDKKGFNIPRGFDRNKGSAILIDVPTGKWQHIIG